MGKIENPLFHDRVVLGKDAVKKLVRDYTDQVHKGRYESAAESLGLKERTLFAYMGGEKKSLPTETFFSVAKSLGIRPEEFDYQRMSLNDVQKKSVKDWRLANPQKLKDINRSSGSLGIIALEKKTGKSRNEIMSGVRGELERKYGEHAYAKIGSQSTEYFKKKYGEEWKTKMTEPMFEALKKKHGKDWGKIVGANANRIARKMFGQNFQVESGKIFYGNNWNNVIHAFQWQRENFQGFEKESLGPLFSKISEAGGYKAVKMVGLLLQEESLSAEELSNKIGSSLKEVRSILHKLSLDSIVTWKAPKTHYYSDSKNEIYYIDKEHLKQRAKTIRRKSNERLVSILDESSESFVSCECGFRTRFEDAFEIGFHCPDCKSVLNKTETPKIIEYIRRRISNTPAIENH